MTKNLSRGAYTPHEQILNQREIISVIDLCSQIPKDDKIFIRNRVKEYFKSLSAGQDSNGQMAQLFGIFSHCSKPLNKVHLYEAHSHSLQVKLRKYISNERRKLKQDCLNQFRREKNVEYTKRNVLAENILRPQKSKSKCKIEPSKIYNPHQRYSRNHNLSPSSSSFHRDFLHRNLSPKVTRPSTSLEANKMANSTGRKPSNTFIDSAKKELQHMGYSGMQRCESFQQFKYFKNKTQINARNKQNQQQGQPRSFIIADQAKPEHENYFNSELLSSIRNSAAKSQLEVDNFLHSSAYSRTNASEQQKINELFSSITRPDDGAARATELYSTNSEKENESLFTPPQLLEQCRRFLRTAENQLNTSRRLTENALLENLPSRKQSLVNVQGKVQSPQFGQKHKLPPFESVREFLKYLFRNGWRINLGAAQKMQLIESSPQGQQDLINRILNQDSLTNEINFINTFQMIRNTSAVGFSFGNIFQLLDIDCKGFVSQEDYNCFLQNFVDCPLQAEVLSKLKVRLLKFKDIVNQHFKGCKIVPGCFEYLQVMGNPQISELAEVLQLFEFEIESGVSNEA